MIKIQIATAPVSWGVLMKDTPGVPPYTQVLDGIAEAGYRGTELGPYGYLPFEKGRLQKELDSRGLQLISAFTLFNFTDPYDRQSLHSQNTYQEAWETVQLLSALNCKYLVLSDALFIVPNRAERAGRIRPEDSLDERGWDQAAANVDRFAKRVWEEYGMKTVAHPHVGGYLEAAFEIDALLERTNPTLVGLCFDMAHIAYGGGDPAAVLEKWQQRVWYMHIKEYDQRVLTQVLKKGGDYFAAVEAGVFPQLGQGTIDWQAIQHLLDQMNYEGWGIVEQDILPGSAVDPLASAIANRRFLQQTLGW